MLTKAILTGGVLSAIAGGVVYFGTAGSDALAGDTNKNHRIEETVLAGAADADVVAEEGASTTSVIKTVSKVEAESEEATQEASMEKSEPKTKWLDQYLKKTKPGADSKSDMKEKADAMEAKLETTDVEVETEVELMEDKTEAMQKPQAERKKRKRFKFKKRMKDAGTDMAEADNDTMSKDEGETRELEIDIDAIDVDALDLDGDIDVKVLKKQLGLEGEKNVQIRVIKKTGSKGTQSKKMMSRSSAFDSSNFDYDMVLAEAKKLLVVDMRDRAVLEIVDFAVDNLDMAEAADLVPEISTPELRDTARARIGAGLARCGKPEAAFAIIDELEIDELAAPIRLEIITALMATRQERQAAGFRN